MTSSIVFPSQMIAPKKVDDSFAEQRRAAHAAGESGTDIDAVLQAYPEFRGSFSVPLEAFEGTRRTGTR